VEETKPMAVSPPRLDSFADRLDYLVENVHTLWRGPYDDGEIHAGILAEQNVALPVGMLQRIRASELAADDIEPFHLQCLAKFFGVSPLFLHTGLTTLAERWDFLFRAKRLRPTPVVDPGCIGREYRYREIARLMLPDGDDNAWSAQAVFLASLRKGKTDPQLSRALDAAQWLGAERGFLELGRDQVLIHVNRIERIVAERAAMGPTTLAGSAARALMELPESQQRAIYDVIMQFRQSPTAPVEPASKTA